MLILVINSGSSSIKFQLLQMQDESIRFSGVLERIGEAESKLTLHLADGSEVVRRDPAPSHDQGMTLILDALNSSGVLSATDTLAAIGHRVVHGGETFHRPALLDQQTIQQIEHCIPLAPLHNPANLAGIEACRRLFPELPQVAVFDTAFHQDMPESAWRYAVPDSWYNDYGVRRYGFHGTSHAYVARQAAHWLERPLEQCNMITLHLGNGASVSAIKNGRCRDTSMGMTPLEGLVMGSRSGDIDPALPLYLQHRAGMSAGQVDTVLNKESGLQALCGDNDMRRILTRVDAGDERASLALEIYCQRIRKYLGAYMAILGRVDALVFTGGIGEHAPTIRRMICTDLEQMGVRLDEQANSRSGGAISEIHSQAAGEQPSIPLLVVRTNEELEIARQTHHLYQTLNHRNPS